MMDTTNAAIKNAGSGNAGYIMKREELTLKDWDENYIPLRVPYEEKEIAKKAGCSWNQKNRLWCIRKSDPRARFVAQTWPLTRITPIELIPSSVWYSNLRSILPQKEWNFIRNDIYRRWGYRCQECGGRGSAIKVNKEWNGAKLEAHEQWIFDEKTNTQILKDVLCLCPDCHLTKHLGFASVRGLLNETLQHLSRVTGISQQDAHFVWRKCMQDWARRSKKEWHLDISWLRKSYPDKEWHIKSDRKGIISL